MAGLLSQLADKLRGQPRRRRIAGKVTPLGMRATGGNSPELVAEPGAFHVNDGPHYHDILAELHRILKPDWYLEIGARGGESLALAKGNYVAIDPVFRRFPAAPVDGKQMHFLAMKSDDAFEDGFLAREGIQPDFGFLDGMHWAEFLMRDFMNFEAAAKPCAIVALHDCLPCTHEMETRDESVTGKGQAWTGDVWKVLWWLTQHRPDLSIHALDAWKTGLVVIEGLDPTNTTLRSTYERFVAEMRDLRLKDFGVERFFAAFPIESSYRYIESLRSRAA